MKIIPEHMRTPLLLGTTSGLLALGGPIPALVFFACALGVERLSKTASEAAPGSLMVRLCSMAASIHPAAAMLFPPLTRAVAATKTNPQTRSAIFGADGGRAAKAGLAVAHGLQEHCLRSSSVEAMRSAKVRYLPDAQHPFAFFSRVDNSRPSKTRPVGNGDPAADALLPFVGELAAAAGARSCALLSCLLIEEAGSRADPILSEIWGTRMVKKSNKQFSIRPSIANPADPIVAFSTSERNRTALREELGAMGASEALLHMVELFGVKDAKAAALRGSDLALDPQQVRARTGILNDLVDRDVLAELLAAFDRIGLVRTDELARMAVEANNERILFGAASLGVDVDRAGADGRTPLEAALSAGKPVCARALAFLGANLTRRAKGARSSNAERLAKTLPKSAANRPALTSAIECASIEAASPTSEPARIEGAASPPRKSSL